MLIAMVMFDILFLVTLNMMMDIWYVATVACKCHQYFYITNVQIKKFLYILSVCVCLCIM